MLEDILFLLVGAALVLLGADKFTDGACGLARKWNVSELVIGLTIVALGTSLPEFIVSFFSVLQGSADMSVGNIVGSNVFNSLVIIGASCLMAKISVETISLKRDIPISILVSLMLFGCAFFDGCITRYDGFLLLFFFLMFMYMTFRIARGSKVVESNSPAKDMSALRITVLIFLGGGSLIYGGNLLVDNAQALARYWGVSESVIGLTILAGGTSLPELATSMMAARKGSHGLALGNVIGSNVFNIAFILGLCSSIMPMQVAGITRVDWLMLIGSSILLWIFAFTGRRISKAEGLLLLMIYLIYLLYLL